MSRLLRLSLPALVLFSLFAPAAHATSVGSCRWLCVGSECRVDAPDGAVCDPDLPRVDALVDAPGDVCLSEPVSWEMVSDAPPVYATDPSAVTAFSAPATASSSFVGFTDPAPADKQKVLLTGFCSNDNFPNNPSGRILPALEKEVKRLCGDKVELTSKCLDITVGAIRECKVEKKIVISMGVCPEEKVRLESGAVNCFIDLDGKPKCEVVKGGAGEISPGSPLPTLPGTIGGYPVSNPAIDPTNTYVCNATYYWLCTKKECKPYFVHIPPLPSDKSKDDAFVKDLAKLICGIVDKNAPTPRFADPWTIASEGEGASPIGR